MAVPLDVGRTHPALSQLQLDLVGDGLDLPRRLARADQEVAREGRDLGDVQDHDVHTFLAVHGLEGDLQTVGHLSP